VAKREKTMKKLLKTGDWEDKFKRLLLRFEGIQQRHLAMKL
jgi:hypothetical protein